MQALLSKNSINCGGTLVSLALPQVMGILNLTPDSFYGKSRIASQSNLLAQAAEMLKDGAAILDIGGQSTRPGAIKISAAEELDRVIPAIKALAKEFPKAILSIDTFYASVAAAAAEEGAHIINDITGGDGDANMFEVLAKIKLPYVLMHNQSVAFPLASAPKYKQITLDVMDYFSAKIAALYELGIADIILDPGFGFGKTLEENYQLMQALAHLKILELPVLVGISRKSMIQKVLQVSADDALNGSSALHMVALQKGAKILRVHDVKAATECIKLHLKLIA